MPLSPSQTRELLERLGHRPKKQLGQNFLIDGNIVRKSLELASVQPGDHVVEIGPGLGTLTLALLNAGAIVHAVEFDPTLASHVESLAANDPNLHLVKGDALDYPIGDLEVGLDGPASRNASKEANPDLTDYKIVANLPYAISTPWMAAVLERQLPSVMTLMLQKEAAQRYAAQPGSKNFGAISIFLHAAFETLLGHDVSASCFYPRPDVGSTLLHLRRKTQPYRFSIEGAKLIRTVFQQRRKQISSLLRQQKTNTANRWIENLERLGVPSNTRPEQIDTKAWIALDQCLND